MDSEEEVTRFQVEASLRKVENWPTIREGYFGLCFFLSFVVLEIVVITMQLNIEAGWMIGSALQEQFGGNALADVYTLDDWWTYVVGGSGVLDFIFNNEWYSKRRFTTDEQGFVREYDKLVGGVLIVQKRGKLVTDGCVDEFGPTSYELFYPNCYTDELITTNDRTTHINTPGIGQAFNYSDTHGGYAMFFAVATSPDQNLAYARELKQTLWLDKQTRSIEIKFALYNGNYNAFSFVKIVFAFGRGGVFLNHNHFTAQSLSMEPYRTDSDKARLYLEIIFMVLVAHQWSAFLLDSFNKVRKDGPGALVALWTIIDLSNLVLLVIFIGLRCYILTLIYENPISVPTNEYKQILETVADYEGLQRVVVFLNICLCLLRLFKFYEFQDRLNILNSTFSKSFVDMYHFVIMFAIVFGLFAVMGHFLFGLSVEEFSSLGLSLQTLWQWLLGGFDTSSTDNASPEMSQVFFITFMFGVNMLLVNIMLAIIMEFYAMAVDIDNPASVADELGVGVRKVLAKLKGGGLNDDKVREALKRLKERDVETVSAEELAQEMGDGDVDAVKTWPNLVPQTEEDEEEETDENLANLIKRIVADNQELRKRLR